MIISRISKGSPAPWNGPPVEISGEVESTLRIPARVRDQTHFTDSSVAVAVITI